LSWAASLTIGSLVVRVMIYRRSKQSSCLRKSSPPLVERSRYGGLESVISARFTAALPLPCGEKVRLCAWVTRQVCGRMPAAPWQSRAQIVHSNGEMAVEHTLAYMNLDDEGELRAGYARRLPDQIARLFELATTGGK